MLKYICKQGNIKQVDNRRQTGCQQKDNLTYGTHSNVHKCLLTHKLSN